ncbi:MAG: AAA family ATPase [Chitinophagaceae bacterium]
MILKTLSLHNFKCLSDIQFSFEKSPKELRKWTLIVGENGVGKTSLLEAIALLTAGKEAFSCAAANTEGLWLKAGTDSGNISATFSLGGKKEQSISLDLFNEVSPKTNEKSLAAAEEIIIKNQTEFLVVAYGATRRKSLGKMEVESGNIRWQNIQNLLRRESTLNPLTDWIFQLKKQKGEAGTDLAKEALHDFFPEISFHSLDTDNEQLLFQSEDGIFPLNQLSDGFQSMAAWIGDLLFRITNYTGNFTDPFDVPGLLLIDEIDIHLHPKWQRQLYNFISSWLPNFQIIATTHSALTAQQADTGELFALKRDENQIVRLLPFAGSPRTLLVNQLLMTPVFGLKTDESLAVEQAKDTYKSQKKKSLTQSGMAGREALTPLPHLDIAMPERAFPTASAKELDLLAKIEAQLNLK